MKLNWRMLILQSLLAVFVAAVILFASFNTSKIHDQQRKIHSGATREPQLADPAAAFVEIILETSPLAQLSAGYVGIAPSMHMIRLGSTRPLSNIDPLEHPARRRFGRIDFSFAFLVFLPIALLPLAYLIYRRCVRRGVAQKLRSGTTTLFDFSVEHIFLPLSGSGGIIALLTLAALYSAGLRLGSNESLILISIWVLLIALYLLGWILLLLFLALRSSSFASALIKYAAVYLVLVFVLPQLTQTLTQSIVRPKGRLPLLAERRKAAQQPRDRQEAALDRLLVRLGYEPLDWSKRPTAPQIIALENLRIEEVVAPKLAEFEQSVQQIDQLAAIGSWISPFLVAQFGVDEIAGTGLSRFAEFQQRSIQFHEQWRDYTLRYLAKRQFLDLDALRNAPKFTMPNDYSTAAIQAGLIRCGYLAALCILLGYGISSKLKRLLPRRRKAAR